MTAWPPRCELVVFPAASLPRSVADADLAVVRAGAFASEVLTGE